MDGVRLGSHLKKSFRTPTLRIDSKIVDPKVWRFWTKLVEIQTQVQPVNQLQDDILSVFLY